MAPHLCTAGRIIEARRRTNPSAVDREDSVRTLFVELLDPFAARDDENGNDAREERDADDTADTAQHPGPETLESRPESAEVAGRGGRREENHQNQGDDK